MIDGSPIEENSPKIIYGQHPVSGSFRPKATFAKPNRGNFWFLELTFSLTITCKFAKLISLKVNSTFLLGKMSAIADATDGPTPNVQVLFALHPGFDIFDVASALKVFRTALHDRKDASE